MNTLDDNIPTGGLGIHVIIGLIATCILIIAVLVYYLFFNTPNQRTITIKNNSNETLNIVISSVKTNNEILVLPTYILDSQATANLTVSPGLTVIISGYTHSNTNPLTYAKIIFGNAGNSSSGKIVFNGQTYSDLITTIDNVDHYGVSMQNGYNVPISVFPNSISSANNNLTPNNFTCTGPVWYQYVSSNNEVFPCPPVLQDNQSCINPCKILGETSPSYCKCENEWEQLDYYYAFESACPNCLITTCDELNYHCSYNDINNHTPINYTVTFFPELGLIS